MCTTSGGGAVEPTSNVRQIRFATRELAEWGSRDLNPGPTDYECDRVPRDRLKIGRFVRGSLTLADPAEQRFSRLCATNEPQDLLGCLVCHLRLHRLVGMEASSTVGSSQDNRVSGIWKLTARLPSTPSTCGSCMTMEAGTERSKCGSAPTCGE